ncbi:Scr1 family TA system antitoxin-like transcriptional regulator [Streptomyces sparsogenes]|uniref:Scr1 family TA system antitoxin-like transcriptional regulator n=1 Tax=Streptomyces sparsogenes TaxID=67365 RepID=UPI003333E4F1
MGVYLRALRLTQGFTEREAGMAIGCSGPKISRLETGYLRRKADAVELLHHYGVEDFLAIRGVQDLLREPRQHVVVDSTPGWLDRLRACQAQAAPLSIYSTYAVPEIAQVPGYPIDQVTMVEKPAALPRVPARQRLSPVTGRGVTVLLDETILMRSLGRPAVMAHQMAHLRDLAASGDGPQVLVVPLQAAVLAPAPSLLYGMRVHGHELVAQEGPGFAVYYTGGEVNLWRERMWAALSAALPAAQGVEWLEQARAKFKELAAGLPSGTSSKRLVG